MSAEDIDRLVRKYVTPEQVAEWRAREAAEQDTEDQPARSRRSRTSTKGTRPNQEWRQQMRRSRRQPLVPDSDEFNELARKYPAMGL